MEYNRRGFLRRFGVGVISLPLLTSTTACSLFNQPEIKVGTVEELNTKKFITLEFNGDSFFVGLDEQGNVYALSLVCTHKECTVRYYDEQQKFICPCHKGTYDKNGIVLSGKPPAPLHRYKTALRNNNEIWLLNQRL